MVRMEDAGVSDNYGARRISLFAAVLFELYYLFPLLLITRSSFIKVVLNNNK